MRTIAGATFAPSAAVADHGGPSSKSAPLLPFLKVALFYGIIGFVAVFGVLATWKHHDQLLDFGSFLASGQAAARGENPYGVYPLTYHFVDDGIEGDAVNRNPPISVLFFQAAAGVDPRVAHDVWTASSIILYSLTIFVLCKAYPTRATPLQIAWAASLAGFWSTLQLGQIYPLLWFAAATAWILLERDKPLAAGILIGFLAAIKPNFAVWPVLLLLAGHTAAALAAIASAATLSAVPLLIYGPRIYLQWLAVLPTHTWISSPTNGSLVALAGRLGVSWLGLVGSAALLIAVGIWAWKLRPSTTAASEAGLVSSLLSSPIAWSGYTLTLLPLFFQRRWSIPLLAAATILIVPDGVLISLSQTPVWYLEWLSYGANLALLDLLVILAIETLTKRQRPLSRGVQ